MHVLLHVLLYSLVLILLNLSFMPFLCPSINYFYRNRQKILPTHSVACKLQVDGSTAREFRNLVAGDRHRPDIFLSNITTGLILHWITHKLNTWVREALIGDFLL